MGQDWGVCKSDNKDRQGTAGTGTDLAYRIPEGMIRVT